MKFILAILLFISYNSACLAGEQITGFEEKDVAVLNEELRKNSDEINQSVKLSKDQTISGTKTFSAFPVTPSSAPTSNYEVANKKYVDDEITASAATLPKFGSWSAASSGTVYQASTDGFAIAWCYFAGAGTISIFTDGSSPPTTERARTGNDSNFGGFVFTPVKKSDYWKVTVNGGATIQAVYWLPLS